MTMQVMLLRKASVFTTQPAHHAHPSSVILENLTDRSHLMLPIKFLWVMNNPQGNQVELRVHITVTPGE
jgi:hypothetical protein